MAYWDLVWETIHKVDEEGLQIYVGIYQKAGEEDAEILVFDDNDSVRQFNDLLKEKMINIPEIQEMIEDYPYDISNRTDWFLDLATENNWTYSDEGFVCDECYKWHFYEDYGATRYVNYKIGDGYIICADCIKSCEQNMEKYIKDMINSPKNANTILSNAELIKLGFDKTNDYPYANGWYGQVDKPEEILAKAKELYPKSEFLFSIVKTGNPWETEFNLWKREVAA